MQKKALLLLLIGSLCAVTALAAKPAQKPAEKKREPAIAMKEKELPPAGTRYIYIDQTTPRYIIDAVRKKGLRPAFLFDQSRAQWLRGVIPTLKGSAPLIFVRGGFSEVDALRFKETLEFFDYAVTLIHLKLRPEDTLGALPVANIIVLERRTEKEKTRFIMTRGKKPAETGTLLSPLDERDLADPLSVAGGIHFAKHDIRLVNIDAEADRKLPPADITVLFSGSEQKLKDYIEK